MSRRPVEVEVNGRSYQRQVEPRLLLSDFLRYDLRLTGTHVGCEHGVCGACTVLLNGEAVRSCLILAVQAHGQKIQTVESLAPSERELHPLQEAFREAHGLQCGFCTAGILMTLIPFLEENPDPSEPEIRQALSGNPVPLHRLPTHRRRRPAPRRPEPQNLTPDLGDDRGTLVHLEPMCPMKKESSTAFRPHRGPAQR